MEQDKNKAPVDREEKPKAKRGTCRKPAAKKKAEKPAADTDAPAKERDRKSTRLNSSHP